MSRVGLVDQQILLTHDEEGPNVSPQTCPVRSCWVAYLLAGQAAALASLVVAAVSAVTAAALTGAISTLGTALGARAAPIKAVLTDCPSLPGNVTCTGWSGNAAGVANITELDAIIDVPQIACPPWSGTGETAIWAGISGAASDGTNTIVQPGVALNCNSGQPSYYAFTTNLTGVSTPLSEPVSAGDAIYLEITTDGSGDYVQQIVDFTASGGFWNQVIDVSGGPVNTSWGLVDAESFNGGVDF